MVEPATFSPLDDFPELRTGQDAKKKVFLIADKCEFVTVPKTKQASQVAVVVRLTIGQRTYDITGEQILDLQKQHNIHEVRNKKGEQLLNFAKLVNQRFVHEELRRTHYTHQIELAKRTDKAARAIPEPIEKTAAVTFQVSEISRFSAIWLMVCDISKVAQKVLNYFQVLSIVGAVTESYHFFCALGDIYAVRGIGAKIKAGAWAILQGAQSLYSNAVFLRFLAAAGKMTAAAISWTPFALLATGTLSIGYGVYNTYKMWSLKRGLEQAEKNSANPAFAALRYVKEHEKEFAERFSIRKEWKFQEKINSFLALSSSERIEAQEKAAALVAALKTHVKKQLGVESVSTAVKVVLIAAAALASFALMSTPVGWGIVAACTVVGLALWAYKEISNARAAPFSQISPITTPLVQMGMPTTKKLISLPWVHPRPIRSFDAFSDGMRKRQSVGVEAVREI
jgi:hypothetical protein